MTNTEWSTYPPSSEPFSFPGDAPTADAAKDDLAPKGAAVFHDSKAGIESVISDAGDYAGKKGGDVMDNVRGVGDALSVAIRKSVTTRPYTTLGLAVAAGFLFGTTWRR
jgi:hypothetical protein